MSKRRVCVVTGTRADYGLLYWLLKYIQEDQDLELQIIATGMHLSSKFGLTYKEIEKDGFKINSKINISLKSDTATGILKSMSVGLSKFPSELKKINPDLMIVLGDRFEIFCASIAAMFCHIPIAHLHGGEITTGVIDESMRHAITKISHIHFVATVQYKNRVIQLGENPSNVYCVGGLGIDNILKLNLLSKKNIESILDFKFNKKNLLITFHPVTLENNTSKIHINELLSALTRLKDTNFIFTMPNADMDGDIIFKMINQFVKNNSNVKVFTSLGTLKYLSCIKYVDAIVGNSSSGLLEVPSFKKATINIGDRQNGRIMADSVINCDSNEEAIFQSISKVYSLSFKKILNKTINPYGVGGASKSILKIIKNIELDNILKKDFHDMESI